MHTILIVDDDEAIQKLLAHYIETHTGFKAIVAEDGEAAIDLIKENKPKLIIMDMLLPRISGPALYNDLRQLEESKETPVIIISGAMMDDVFKVEGIEMGAVEYLTKPIDLKYLGEKIREYTDS